MVDLISFEKSKLGIPSLDIVKFYLFNESLNMPSSIPNASRKKTPFAGMSSEYAQNKYFGGFKSEYRSSEGRQKLVLIKDNLEDVINYICGGIRSCMTYIGCHNMKHMQKHMVFYKVNRQGGIL